MDRFESIEVLKDFLEGDTCRGDVIIETLHEDAALKMAIEALEIGTPDEFRELKEAENRLLKHYRGKIGLGDFVNAHLEALRDRAGHKGWLILTNEDAIEYEQLKGQEIMYQQCIAELFLFVENITERAVKKDLSVFRCPGAGGCDMYQGMPPICRKRDDILHRYEDIIYEAIKTQN